MKSILGFLTGISIVLVLSLVYVEITTPDVEELPSTSEAARLPDTLRAAPDMPPTPLVPELRAPAPAPVPAAAVAVEPAPPVPPPPPVPTYSPPAATPPPVSEPEPTGPVRTNDDIERQARINRIGTDGCYMVAQSMNPRASGTIAVRMTVSAQGRVTAFAITTDSVRDPDFALCMEDEIRSWRFGPAGDTFTGTYTFSFGR